MSPDISWPRGNPEWWPPLHSCDKACCQTPPGAWWWGAHDAPGPLHSGGWSLETLSKSIKHPNHSVSGTKRSIYNNTNYLLKKNKKSKWRPTSFLCLLKKEFISNKPSWTFGGEQMEKLEVTCTDAKRLLLTVLVRILKRQMPHRRVEFKTPLQCGHEIAHDTCSQKLCHTGNRSMSGWPISEEGCLQPNSQPLIPVHGRLHPMTNKQHQPGTNSTILRKQDHCSSSCCYTRQIKLETAEWAEVFEATFWSFQDKRHRI